MPRHLATLPPNTVKTTEYLRATSFEFLHKKVSNMGIICLIRDLFHTPRISNYCFNLSTHALSHMGGRMENSTTFIEGNLALAINITSIGVP